MRPYGPPCVRVVVAAGLPLDGSLKKAASRELPLNESNDAAQPDIFEAVHPSVGRIRRGIRPTTRWLG